MENSFKSVIDSANSILILLPTNPDFDQVAAGLSLYLSLMGGKNIQIAAISPITVQLNRLIAVNKISTELGNKNLVLSFYDYKAEDIEKVSYDIDNGQFRLTVIPKPGVAAPSRDQVKVTYTGVSADTVILIGGTSEKHFPAIYSNDLVGTKLIHIGNRPLTSDSEKGIMSFVGSATSVSEVVFSLINEASLTLDPDIATNLLVGIEEATDNFKSPEVAAKTFETVAALMRAGGRRFANVGIDTNAFPPGAIPEQVPAVQTQSTSQNVISQKDLKGQDKPEEEVEDRGVGEPPADWLQPKIYKGTSIS
jgi:hypothetical protein